MAGLQEVGIAACAKHFPGHGDTVVDSHLGLPRITVKREVLDERELEPFRAAVEAGVACIMTAHIVVGAIDPGSRPHSRRRCFAASCVRSSGSTASSCRTRSTWSVPAARSASPRRRCGPWRPAATCSASVPRRPARRSTRSSTPCLVAVAQGRLAEERLVEAHGRVARLAADAPTTASPPGHCLGALESGVEQAFEIAEAARSWLASPRRPASSRSRRGPTRPSASSRGDRPRSALPRTQPLCRRTQGRGRRSGLAAGHPAWDVCERLRAGGHRTIVVECGWPRDGADIVTFGGSAAVARRSCGCSLST